MAPSRELMVLVKYHDELIVTIRNDLEAIAGFLFLKEIISRETYREATDGKSYHTDHDRAKIVLRCLEDKVEEDTNYYHIFYEFLKSKKEGSKLIAQMNEEGVLSKMRSKWL